MPTKDVKTKFRLEFEGKGAEALQKKISALAEGLSPEKLSGGFQRMEYFMKQNEKQLRGMERHFKQLNQSLFKFGETVDKINEMADGLGKVRDNARGAGEEAKKAGAFLQGLAQGAGFGEYLPRGPGMGRQIAGRVVGGGLRRAAGVGGGLAQIPVSGVGGLAAGLSSIPGGGLAGGALQAAMSNVQQFRQFERSRLEAAPYLDLAGVEQQAQEARDRAAQGAEGRFTDNMRQWRRQNFVTGTNVAGLASKQSDQLLLKYQERVHRLQAEGKPVPESLQRQLRTRERIARGHERLAGEVTGSPLNQEAMRKAEAGFRQQEQARQNAAANQARERALRERGLGGLGEIGQQFGIGNVTQATQFAMQVAQASGGTLGEIRAPGDDLVRKAAAARRFGIGPEAVGAFGLAARRGGLTGVQGTGAGDFEDTWKEAVAAGMDASEIRQFMQETAQGIQQFRQTGIPMAPETVVGIGNEFSKVGLQIGRSQAIGGALGRRAQQIGMQGPQSAADFLMLQTVGGFQGGGLGNLWEAQKKMQNLKKGQGTPQGMMEMIRRVSEGAGGGTAGLFSIQKVMRDLGAQVNAGEVETLQAAVEGRALPKEAQAILERTQKQQQAGANRNNIGGLEQQALAAMSTLGKHFRTQIGLENDRIAIGAKLVTSMDAIEKSMIHAQTAVAEFAPALSGLTEHIKTITSYLPKASEYVTRQMEPNASYPTDQAAP